MLLGLAEGWKDERLKGWKAGIDVLGRETYLREMHRLPAAAIVFALLTGAGPTAPPTPPPPVTFKHDVQPILESRCMPCHFTGGKMYAALPFDKPETIVRLGEKLFTRIKDPKSQAVIRQFLAAEGQNRPAARPGR
jgi:hypothetical protein